MSDCPEEALAIRGQRPGENVWSVILGVAGEGPKGRQIIGNKIGKGMF